MLKVEDIVNIKFEGFFQRHPDLVRESAEATEETRIKRPDLYDERKAMDEKINREYNFTVYFLHYNPQSGIFIARGTDDFGESGLVGSIYLNGEIKFLKRYEGIRPEEMERFSQIEFSGTIQKPDNIVTLGGSYHPVRTQNYDGIWRLDSIPKE